MMKPFVSVVIPTHNRPSLLERSIGSVLRQSYSDFEVIVVSDYPPEHEETNSIIEKINDLRVKFVRSWIPGANASRNIGIITAKGEIIAYLDDDDEWYPEKLAEHVLAHRAYDMVCSQVLRRYEKENGDVYDIFPRSKIDVSQAAERMVRFEFCPATSSSVSVKREIALKYKWDEDLRSYQDWDVWFRVLDGGSSLGVINKCLVVFYQHKGVRTSKGFLKRKEALRVIYEKHKPRISEVSYRNQINNEFVSFLLEDKGLLYAIKRLNKVFEYSQHLSWDLGFFLRIIYYVIKPNFLKGIRGS